MLHSECPPKKIGCRAYRAILLGLATVVLLSVFTATTAHAQRFTSFRAADSTDTYWKRFALGFGAILLAHESAHFLASRAMGYHPYIAFDKLRPTVYSGIDSEKEPHKQFIFSAAGLTTQALIDEAILDIPIRAAELSSEESSPAESARHSFISHSAATPT